MLNQAKTLKGYKLNGLDGEIGDVKEFYFDDQRWTVRYLVAETRDWLKAGKIHYREEIVDGLEAAPATFIGMLKGSNFGKCVIRVGSSK